MGTSPGGHIFDAPVVTFFRVAAHAAGWLMVAGLATGWLAGRLAGRPAGWLAAGWMVGWVAGWPVGWSAGALTAWLAPWWMAGWLAGCEIRKEGKGDCMTKTNIQMKGAEIKSDGTKKKRNAIKGKGRHEKVRKETKIAENIEINRDNT